MYEKAVSNNFDQENSVIKAMSYKSRTVLWDVYEFSHLWNWVQVPTRPQMDRAGDLIGQLSHLCIISGKA